MKYGYAYDDPRKAAAANVDRIAVAAFGAMSDLTGEVKGAARDQVRTAGLGDRLANTWQGRTYPGRPSLDPATYVWSKAPVIVGAYANGASIYPTGGRFYLAIPTAAVPRKGRGKKMTPLDVEVAFNQDLIIRPGRKPGALLAFVDKAQARFSRSQGVAYPRRQQRRAGKPQLVLMFTLTRGPVTVRPRLDLQRLARDAEARVQPLLDQHLAALS